MGAENNFEYFSKTNFDGFGYFSKSKNCKEVGEKSLQFRKTQIWNEIPSEIRSCDFFNAFKKAYKKFLIEATIEGT